MKQGERNDVIKEEIKAILASGKYTNQGDLARQYDVTESTISNYHKEVKAERAILQAEKQELIRQAMIEEVNAAKAYNVVNKINEAIAELDGIIKEASTEEIAIKATTSKRQYLEMLVKIKGINSPDKIEQRVEGKMQHELLYDPNEVKKLLEEYNGGKREDS